MNKVLAIALCLLMSIRAAYGCCGTGSGCCGTSSSCCTTSCTGAIRVDNNNNVIQEDNQDNTNNTRSTQD